MYQKLPLTNNYINKLIEISSLIYYKDIFPQNYSGVVIAGFGDSDTFPVVEEYQVEAIINNRLKYNLVDRPHKRINFNNTAAIIPFAQSDSVATFLEGIDPKCKNIIYSYLENLFADYPIKVLDKIKNINQKDKQKLTEELSRISKELVDFFKKNIDNYIREKNIDPIINTVAFLPKDELALMAESLVNLTSFKQRISMDSETVGGPIDVAIISKGDGFVWIKRKHYFKQELNPHYLSKYYLDN